MCRGRRMLLRRVVVVVVVVVEVVSLLLLAQMSGRVLALALLFPCLRLIHPYVA